MVNVEIKIVANATTDIYTRHHAKSIDAPMPLDWYKEGTASPYYIGTAKTTFTHTQTVDLPAGRHTIYYSAASTASGYYWEAEVFVNGVSLGKQSDLWFQKLYVADFEVKAGLGETIGAMIPAIMGLMMAVMLISLVSRLMKAFKRKA